MLTNNQLLLLQGISRQGRLTPLSPSAGATSLGQVTLATPEFYKDLVQTILTADYVAGSGVISVQSTGLPWSQTQVMHIQIVDQATLAVKALLQLTVLKSPTQWNVTADSSNDGNAAAGDIVRLCLTEKAMDQIRLDMSQYGVETSLPSTIGQKEGNWYRASDTRALYRFTSGAWVRMGGGLHLLESHDANNSASIDFTNWYSAAFDEYEIRFLNVAPVSAGQDFNFRISTNGGSSYDAGTIYFWAWHYNAHNGGEGQVNGSGVAQVTLFTGIQSSSGRPEGCSGRLSLFDPGHASNPKTATYQLYAPQSSFVYNASGFAYWNQAPAPPVNGVRFFFPSGNIATGRFRLYGIGH